MSTAHPDSFACFTNSAMSAVEGRSRLLVGSSSSRFVGCMAQMLAKATFWRSPPESWKMLRPARDRNPSSSKVASTRARMSSSGRPALSRANATSPVVSTLKNWVRGFWKREPALRAISHVVSPSTASPSSRALPSTSPGKKRGASPPARRSRVDLPHPERPQSTTTSPEPTDSDTSSTPAPSAAAGARYEKET